MKRKLILNTLRSVKNTKSRFFAIMAIIAIGSGFFAGIKSCAPDLKKSSAQYLDEENLADIHIVSDLGLDDEDVNAVKGTGITDSVYAGYSADLFLEGGESVVKVYSYSPDSGVNLPYVTEGRLPEAPGEAFCDDRFYSADTPEIGDTLTLSDEDGALTRTEFTVVGKGQLPIYAGHERGSTDIGNGTVNGWLLVPEENFSGEVYTDLYVSIADADGVDPYGEEYPEIISSTADKLEQLGDTQIEHRKSVITADAYEEIDSAKAELEQGRKELADAEKELEDGKQTLAENEQKLSDARQEIADGEKQLETARQQLSDSENDYNNGIAAVNELNGVVTQIEEIISEYASASGDPETLSEKISGLNGENFTADENLEQLLSGYLFAADDSAKAASRAGLEQYAAGLRAQISETETTLASAYTQLEAAGSEIETAEAELESHRAEIAEGEAEIENAKAEIADAEKEIADAKSDIADGEAEIQDAERELHDLVDGAGWYVLGRDYNPGYSGFAEDCDRVDAIANVFPVFFILVAALVCCTTMTRMVEEQRTQIGTLKALGYSRYSIISQYVLYALAASVPGVMIGLLIGFSTLPYIIYQCYKSSYSLPYLVSAFRWDYSIGCLAAACLCTGLSALYASRLELVSCPAQLMRPKPPKNGRRIFLERIGFIWKRLKFTTKVTFRNLFRYKSRLFMTIVGIAGCTALLLAGFGLQYSITSIVDKQYGEIFRYDALVALDDEAEGYAGAAGDCDGTGLVSDRIFVIQDTADISGSAETVETYLVVTEEPEALEKFIDLHTRKGGDKIALGDGVVLSEKLAKKLDADVGGTVRFEGTADITVTAICENYTYDYAYMTRQVYDSAGFPEYRANVLLLNMTEVTDENEDALSQTLVKNDAVLAVSFSSKGGERFRDLISSLSMIIVVLIVAAGALAFVVLFNLSNININERVRELATIKVLGFYDGEVAAYVYRENILLTIMGTVVGLALGVVLEKFVINTAEVDSVMFSPDIPVYCFLEAALLTFLFAFIVNFTLYFRLKKIDMATSLKAIE